LNKSSQNKTNCLVMTQPDCLCNYLPSVPCMCLCRCSRTCLSTFACDCLYLLNVCVCLYDCLTSCANIHFLLSALVCLSMCASVCICPCVSACQDSQSITARCLHCLNPFIYFIASCKHELHAATAETSSLQSQLQAADTQIYVTDTQLQASRLNMRYLKVRQQLSQAAPALSYVQAYEVCCAPQDQGSSQATQQ